MFGSFSNQIDGLHQQIVVKVFVEVEQKVQTDFAKGKGKNQSGKVENEVFVILGFLLNLNVIKERKVRGKMVILRSISR